MNDLPNFNVWLLLVYVTEVIVRGTEERMAELVDIQSKIVATVP